jgi:predicted secreted hydrolase
LCLLALLGILCRAETSRAQSLQFPFDHGPHFDARNEWWYFTGDVQTAEGERLGFEFTIFKRWIQRLHGFAYLAHLAVSTPRTAEHYFQELRAQPPLSSIVEGQLALAFDNCSCAFLEPNGFVFQAHAGPLAFDMALRSSEDVTAHGQDGIILMGDGLPSYYYSFTNLDTSGDIRVNGQKHTVVSGRTWMDHQWGSFTLLGMYWDWFSLRLEDGGALMLSRQRGFFDRVVRTIWTHRAASGEIERGEGFSIAASQTYQDDRGDCTYPIDWSISIPGLDADFSVRPLFDAQSLHGVMTPYYWEGLCSVEGRIGGVAASGSAYVELTGYEDNKADRFLRHLKPH